MTRFWLPLRTSVNLAILAALAFALLTYGLLQIVARSAADLALVRAEAQMDILRSKIASLPANIDHEEFVAEIQTLVTARALDALDANRCDSRQRSREIVMMQTGGQAASGTNGVAWPVDGVANPFELAVPAGSACQLSPSYAMATVADVGRDVRILSAVTVSPDPALERGAYLLSAAIFAAFLLIAGIFAWAVTRDWRTRLERLNALLDRADRTGFSERADLDRGPVELTLLASHLNALLDRSQALIAGLRRLHRHVAHDLRSPLMVARKLVGDMGDGKQAGGKRDAETLQQVGRQLETVEKRCRAVLGIIDAEAITRGDEKPLDPRVHVDRLIDDMFVYLGDDKELEFRVEGQGRTIKANPDLFDRMIENLFGNAVKFAAPGTVIMCKFSDHDDELMIAVENTGPNVSPQKLNRLFEPGFSNSREGTDSHGLGLALVKTVAARSGGSVSAANLPHGFRVEIRLPILKNENDELDWKGQ